MHTSSRQRSEITELQLNAIYTNYTITKAVISFFFSKSDSESTSGIIFLRGDSWFEYVRHSVCPVTFHPLCNGPSPFQMSSMGYFSFFFSSFKLNPHSRIGAIFCFRAQTSQRASERAANVDIQSVLMQRHSLKSPLRFCDNRQH